jgi:hypothetical protein
MKAVKFCQSVQKKFSNDFQKVKSFRNFKISVSATIMVYANSKRRAEARVKLRT